MLRTIRPVSAASLFVLFCALARCQSSVDDVLKSVASTCRELYQHGYVVDIDHHRTDQRRFDGSSPNSDRMGVPAPQMKTASEGMVDRIVLGRSSRNFRFELVNTTGEDWQWTTDGRTIWCYRRDLKAYTEVKAAPWPQRLGPGDGLPGYEWKYFTKFLAIADATGQARILDDNIPPDQDCLGASVLIELTLAGGDEPAKERLRVLTHEHLPCHSTASFVRWARGIPYDFKEDIAWRFRDRVDPNLFVFTPDKQAKRVSRFPRLN